MSFPEPFYSWRPHPWHGLSVGPNAPHVVHAYIEITPFDRQIRVDKETGYLRVDRPQRTSSPPTCTDSYPEPTAAKSTSTLSCSTTVTKIFDIGVE